MHDCQEPTRPTETPVTSECWKMSVIYSNKCKPDSLHQIWVPGWGFLHRREMFTEILNFRTVFHLRKSRAVISVALPECFIFQVISMDAYSTRVPSSFWAHLSMKCWNNDLPACLESKVGKGWLRENLSLLLAHVPESLLQADEKEKDVSCTPRWEQSKLGALKMVGRRN